MLIEELLNAFKKQRENQKLNSVVAILLLVHLFLGCWLCYLYTHPKSPEYYYTTFNGYYGKLSSLELPNTSDEVVRQWANLAVIDSFTYDFVNYKQELKKNSQYFTEDGWSSFLLSITTSNNLSTVISKKLVVSAVAIKPPSILKKGYLNGVYSWRIQLPILVTYQSASEFIQQNVLVTLLVSRISTLDNPKGVGIEQFISTGYVDDTNTSAGD